MQLPTNPEDLMAAQQRLGRLQPEPWAGPDPGSQPPLVAAAFVTFGRGGSDPGQAGDAGWAAAACFRGDAVGPCIIRAGAAGAPYRPGLLLLREGPLLLAVLGALSLRPDLLLLNSTGRDHPRGAGVALHLGALLDIPSVGVTDRPLLARAGAPGPAAGDSADLTLHGERIGHALRIRAGVRPLLVHAAWRTTPDVALEVVRSLPGRGRTPLPLCEARRLAREARAGRLPAPPM